MWTSHYFMRFLRGTNTCIHRASLTAHIYAQTATTRLYVWIWDVCVGLCCQCICESNLTFLYRFVWYIEWLSLCVWERESECGRVAVAVDIAMKDNGRSDKTLCSKVHESRQRQQWAAANAQTHTHCRVRLCYININLLLSACGIYIYLNIEIIK